MKRIRLSAYITCMLLLALFSCREQFEPEPFTYSQLLTGKVSKTWRLTGISILEDGAPTQNIPVQDNDCAFDDRYVFYANEEKKFEVQNGATKCDESEGDIVVTDIWAFSNANATLEMILPILSIDTRLPFIVKSLKDVRLSMEIFFDGGSYRFVLQAVKTQD